MTPTITHDTKRIIAANQDLLDLFRCELQDVLDADMEQGIISDDMRSLMRLRMRVLREHGRDELPEIIFAFLRHDGTMFQAKVKTRRMFGDRFETSFEYLNEY